MKPLQTEEEILNNTTTENEGTIFEGDKALAYLKGHEDGVQVGAKETIEKKELIKQLKELIDKFVTILEK